jgi:hypothetical protein
MSTRKNNSQSDAQKKRKLDDSNQKRECDCKPDCKELLSERQIYNHKEKIRENEKEEHIRAMLASSEPLPLHAESSSSAGLSHDQYDAGEDNLEDVGQSDIEDGDKADDSDYDSDATVEYHYGEGEGSFAPNGIMLMDAVLEDRKDEGQDENESEEEVQELEDEEKKDSVDNSLPREEIESQYFSEMNDVEKEFSEKANLFKTLSSHLFRKAFADFNLTRSCMEEILKSLSSLSEAVFGLSLFEPSMYFLEKEFMNDWSECLVQKMLCTKCGAAYEKSNDNEQRLCACVSYERNRRVVCNSPLLEKSSAEKWRPVCMFNYVPLNVSFSRILQTEYVLDKCKYGISRIANSPGDLMDIYDGEIFQRKYKDECQSFLDGQLPYFPIYVMLNCDGFCPFKYRVHSSWCFLLTICNLPRCLRNKQEFTILWSVVEPPKDGGMNGILEELVKDLQSVYDGFKVNGQVIRVKLVMTCCDLPASRKLLGFTSISSTVACQFCKYQFPRQSSQKLSPPNFSGFEYEKHGVKCHSDLVESSILYINCRTSKRRKEIAKKSGFRDSPFLKLEYLDIMDIQTIDIMHLIGLGVVKRMLLMITKPGFLDESIVLNDSQIADIQKYLDFYNSHLPADVYKLPAGFMHHLKSGKAAEFFTILPVLPCLLACVGCNMNVVRTFALLAEICAIATSKTIDEDDVANIENVCREFYILYEEVFGANITINTHLVLHIHEQLKKFGPMVNYHLFCYERINKILSMIQTCNRPNFIEFGMLKRWHMNNYYTLMTLKLDYANNELLNMLRKDYCIPDKECVDAMFNAEVNSFGNEVLPEGSCFLGLGEECSLKKIELNCVQKLLNEKYSRNVRNIPRKYIKYKVFSYGNAIYTSKVSSKKKSSHITAMFSERNVEGQLITRIYMAHISYFMQFTYENDVFYLMRVKYLYDRQNTRSCWKNDDGSDAFGIKGFNSAIYYKDSLNTVIPINRISGRFSLIESNVAIELDRKLRT